MDIRTAINEKPGVAMGVASGVILIALLCILLQASKRSHMYSAAVPKAFTPTMTGNHGL